MAMWRRRFPAYAAGRVCDRVVCAAWRACVRNADVGRPLRRRRDRQRLRRVRYPPPPRAQYFSLKCHFFFPGCHLFANCAQPPASPFAYYFTVPFQNSSCQDKNWSGIDSVDFSRFVTSLGRRISISRSASFSPGRIIGACPAGGHIDPPLHSVQCCSVPFRLLGCI